ncbi:MAG TPA: hypothetical protein VE053_01180 [Allosphingosinicella sp.]|nr:hypothetical protein [Allosphingosinicella sp.]
MSAGRGSGVQGAIDFLTGPELNDLPRAALPPRIDYDPLTRHARDLGYDLSPGALQEAFRLLMRARLLASRKRSGIE